MLGVSAFNGGTAPLSIGDGHCGLGQMIRWHGRTNFNRYRAPVHHAPTDVETLRLVLHVRSGVTLILGVLWVA